MVYTVAGDMHMMVQARTSDKGNHDVHGDVRNGVHNDGHHSQVEYLHGHGDMLHLEHIKYVVIHEMILKEIDLPM